MKSISRLIDTLLLYAVSWLGGPVHGLSDDIESDYLPEYRKPHGRMRFAHP